MYLKVIKYVLEKLLFLFIYSHSFYCYAVYMLIIYNGLLMLQCYYNIKFNLELYYYLFYLYIIIIEHIFSKNSSTPIYMDEPIYT